MTEIRTPNPEANFIWPVATWTNAYRAMMKEIQDFLGGEFWDSDTSSPENSGQGVFGFNCTEGAALRSDLEPGVGLAFDAANTQSDWGWIYHGATTQKTHSAHDATNPRIDLISIGWALDTDTTENLSRRDAAPANTDTQRGSVATITLTAGTPAASPAAPATPAGHIVLWHVYVPATAGALVYLDKRPRLPGPRHRGTQPVDFNAQAADGTHNLVRLIGRREAFSETAWTSTILGWSKTLDAPYVSRARAVGGTHYHMLAESQEWKRVVPWMHVLTRYDSGNSTDTPVAFDSNGVKISRAAASAVDVFVMLPIPTDGRKLSVVAARLLYDYDVLFATPFAPTLVQLVKRTTAGDTVIGEADLDAAGASPGRETIELYEVGTPANPITETALGDPQGSDDFVALFMWVRVTLANTGSTAGALWLYGADVTFKEYGGE